MTALKHEAVLEYALVACWLSTALIGYYGFFKNHELLSQPLLGIDLHPMLVFICAVVVFTAGSIAIFSKPNTAQFLYALSLGSYLIICIADVHRITPYMIVFYGIFGCFIFLKHDRVICYTALIYLMSGLYVFSGIHKFNTGFITDIAPRFYFHSLPIPYNSSIGYSMAFAEVLLGLLLLFKSTRKTAASVLIAMHLIIIWKLSPWKYGANYIVLPWNIAMIFCHVYVVQQAQVMRFKIGSNGKIFMVIGLFFWLVPFASIFVPVPENIAVKLYSGKSLPGYISFISKEPDFKALDLTLDKTYMVISLQQLSMKQRGIAFNPEPLIYKKVMTRFSESYPTTYKLHLQRLQNIEIKFENHISCNPE